MQELLNGELFQRLMDNESLRLQQKYNLKKVDLQVIKYIDRGASYNTAKDLVELGIFEEEEIISSLERLRKQNLIDFVKNKNDQTSVGVQLTKAGKGLWELVQERYQRVEKVLFKGMTDEQVKTFRRLSQNILDNIEAELQNE